MAGLKLVFFGTPDFAVPTLAALLEAGHDIVAVYSQPPRPAGRGKALRKSPVHDFAEGHDLPVFTPKSLKKPDEIARLSALGADAGVVVAFGQILPKAVLDAPRLGCFNVHASLLPRWRGAAPIHRAVMAGDKETGITIMQMDEGLDTGPMLLDERLAISEEDTTLSLHDPLADMGARLMVQALDDVEHNRLQPRPQPTEGVTYAAKIDKAESRIDWSRDAHEIAAMVRGLYPFPGATTTMNGERLKILVARPVERTGDALAGEVLDGGMTIACGRGALEILRIQREGRAAMDIADFLRGHRLEQGQRLGHDKSGVQG